MLSSYWRGKVVGYWIICIIIWIICGFLSMDLRQKKGYNGGFLLGFVLGLIGLIYCAGLPDITKKKIKKQANNESIIENETENVNVEIEEVVFCKKCGNQIFDDEKKCSNCGEKK